MSEPPSPSKLVNPAQNFWNEISRAKAQRGHVHAIKWLQHDIDRPLISMHKIKLNSGGRVQFQFE